MNLMTDIELKDIQLSILKATDDFCRKNNIEYFLAYGTLLGAIRHKGYIPWDDDIDIVMYRKDYERLIKEFNIGRKDQYKILHCSIDKNYPYGYAKICDMNTQLVEEIGIKYKIGVNIDVFVLDFVGNNKSNAVKLNKKLKFYKNQLNRKYLLSNNEKNRNLCKRIGVNATKFIGNLTSVYFCTNKINEISRIYCNDDKSQYISIICFNSFDQSYILENRWFEEKVEVNFEGFKFYAPKEYDKVLKKWYGHWQEYPPLEKQKSHHSFKAYIIK